MPWLSLASGLLKLTNWVMAQVSRKQLIDEGEKNVILVSLANTVRVLSNAKARQKRVADMSDSDLDDQL